MWQVWAFIAPGLYAHEKRFAIPFVMMSTVFFTLGCAFSHYVAFPAVWNFFGSFADETVQFAPRIEPVFSLYVRMALGLGVVFEMPTLVMFLARVGHGDPALPHPAHQVRHPHHLHRRGHRDARAPIPSHYSWSPCR